MAKKGKGDQLSFGDNTEIFNVVSMDDVMHDSMLPYAEHVILERALPRVEDGLKPVQRRIIYTMLELGNTPDKPHKKSARIVGECLGKFHPHGDSSVYDAMVRMAQDFNMRLPLVDGHGNFGSIDGDSAAAMRYTEVRMAPSAMDMVRDIEKDTVKFCLNFSDTLKEPEMLPGRFPNLLINGANGIAVGLTTSIPTHNPKEAIDAVIARIKDPKISLDEIMKIMPCPDFPTGGYIIKSPEIRTAYETGRGKLINRAKTQIETLKNGKKQIVVTEFPYQVNKARALEGILKLVQEKKTAFANVTDIRDESDRHGIRAVIELKKDADEQKILRNLFKYSDLQRTFGVIMVAIAEGKPKQLSLLELIDHYIRYQEEVVTKRTRNELEAAEHRAHILDGLMIALLNIDEVIKLIRASKSPKIAKQGLMDMFDLTAIQADAILDLRLQRLTNLEQIAIEREHDDLIKEIARLKGLLASKKKLDKMIIDELTEISNKYADPRRTQLISDDGTVEEEEETAEVDEPAAVLVLPDNKLRRIPLKLLTDELVESDGAVDVYKTMTANTLRLFTDTGFMLSLPISDIPEIKPTAKPTNLSALIPMENGEKVIGSFIEDAKAGRYIFYTASGMVKSTAAEEYITKTKRVAAINLKDDKLIGFEYVLDETELGILLMTKKGMGIRFDIASIPVTGRQTGGVHGIKLDEGDSVLWGHSVNEEGEILTVTDRGYMKRSFVFDHDLQGRNGRGAVSFGFKKNGSNGTELVSVLHVTEPRDITLTQLHGTKTVINSEEVKIESRNGKGQLMVMVILDDVIVKAE
ncbi:MAG: DNA topoisomerase 4 subunit A [Clostridiales bacterium]|nr:DNA topoisomerase 4 subunit A [Clostridiales bacterium]